MQKTTLSSFNILGKLQMELSITENPYDLELDNLMSLGARINPKRSFLFISKLLGKHLEVKPDIPKVAGYLLADLYAKHYHGESFYDTKCLIDAINIGNISLAKRELNKQYVLPNKVLFLGFAETATALGHSVFSAFENAYYVHTTREEIKNMKSIFDFKEEHSHATDHSCYLMNHIEVLKSVDRIVLVDDEVTTGKTSLNLIRSISNKYGVNKFSLLTILDWRTPEWLKYMEDFCKETGIEIEILPLIKGSIEVTKGHYLTEPGKAQEPTDYPSIPMVIEENFATLQVLWGRVIRDTPYGTVSYNNSTGRFGIFSKSTKEIEGGCAYVGHMLKKTRKSDKSLVLGTGEFMYLPSRIASYMGQNVGYKSTTRSPIYPANIEGYPIRNRITFKIEGIDYYLYNMENAYEEVFIILEKKLSDQDKHELTKALAKSNVKYIHFVMV